MSINSIQQIPDSELPFILLDHERLTGYVFSLTVEAYPISLETGIVNKKYEHTLKGKAKLYFTTQRLIFMFYENTEGINSLNIWYRQLNISSTYNFPLDLKMPWLGQNYLTLKFNILSDQIDSNGPWLNYIYTWELYMYMMPTVNIVTDFLHVKNLFDLNERLKDAILKYYTHNDNDFVGNHDIPLPIYTP